MKIRIHPFVIASLVMVGCLLGSGAAQAMRELVILVTPRLVAQKLDFLKREAQAEFGRDAAWFVDAISDLRDASGRVKVEFPSLPSHTADDLRMEMELPAGDEIMVLLRPAPGAVPGDEITVVLQLLSSTAPEDEIMVLLMPVVEVIPKMNWLVGRLNAGDEHEAAEIVKIWLRVNFVGIEHEDIG